jgi:hypothetical protein
MQNVNRVFWQLTLVLVVVLSEAWKFENMEKKGSMREALMFTWMFQPATHHPSPLAVN